MNEYWSYFHSLFDLIPSLVNTWFIGAGVCSLCSILLEDPVVSSIIGFVLIFALRLFTPGYLPEAKGYVHVLPKSLRL